MKYILILTLVACATINQSWKEQRGYSDEDIALAKPYFDEYNKMMSTAATFGSTAYNNSAVVNTGNKIFKIFCNCFKKLGSKCQQKPVGLTEDEKRLWAKSNGAESILEVYSSPINGGAVSKADPDMC